MLLKTLAERVVKDHTKSNDRLKQVAADFGVEITEKSVQPDHQKITDHLRELKGEEFDRAYVRHQIKEHEEDVAQFKRAAAEAKSKPLASFAKDTLPILEEHLRAAKELHAVNAEGERKGHPDKPLPSVVRRERASACT